MMAAKRLVPYARISRVAGRDKRGDAFIAEKNYREQIERWAESKDVTLLPWQCDFEQSGGRLRGRPRLDEVMELIRSGEADGVVTPEASRFSRAGLRDALDLIAAIREHGAAFVPLDVPGAEDPDNADAEMALNIWLAVAHRQLRKHQENWSKGKREAIGRGVPISRANIGYRHDWRRGDDGRPDPALGSKGLVKVPGEAKVVKRAFELFDRQNLHAAIDHLAKHAPGHKWTTTTIRRLLKNDVYLGHVRYGDLVKEGAHKPIVSPALFSRVQAKLAQAEPNARGPKADYPLSGFVVCAGCGTPMLGSQAGAKDKDGNHRRVYRCGSMFRKDVDCPATKRAMVSAEPLESHVRQVAAAVAGWAEQGAAGDGALEAAQAALEAAEHERDVFAGDVKARGLLGEAAWTKALEARAAAVAEAQAQVAAALEGERPRRVVPPAAILGLDGAELGQVVRDLFTRVIVRKGRGNVPGRVTFEPRAGESALAGHLARSGEGPVRPLTRAERRELERAAAERALSNDAFMATLPTPPPAEQDAAEREGAELAAALPAGDRR